MLLIMGRSTYIFDVDGVLNSDVDYIPNKHVLNQIVGLLNDGAHVAINTGRGHTWVKYYITDKIQESVPGDIRDHIFVAAEMGGITVEYAEGFGHEKRSGFSLTPQQIKQVRKVYETYKPSRNIAWYDGKLSMATIYKPFEIDANQFLAEAREIAHRLEILFANEDITINLNPDALDVTAKGAGKWAGASLIYDWLKRRSDVNQTHFLCFGDNASDYEMARFFSHRGHTVEFIFTGNDLGEIEYDERVKLAKTTLPYCEGTFSYLRSKDDW